MQPCNGWITTAAFGLITSTAILVWGREVQTDG
jgi:hypothetical protein